jgi:hypothetical protein
MQVIQQLEIRERQYCIAQALLENLRHAGVVHALYGQNHDTPAAGKHEGAIVQLNMGEGKTRVILPMLVLALSKTAAFGGSKRSIVRLNFLDALLQDAITYLHQVLTGALSNRSNTMYRSRAKYKHLNYEHHVP